MSFSKIAALFSKKDTRRQTSTQFPELNQGRDLLKMRRVRQKRLLSNMSIIDGINNPHQSIAHYTSDSCPRYAYCPQGANVLIENFEQRGNCPGQGGISSCSTTSGCPRYGHCPPTAKDLLWIQDDDETARGNEMDKFNRQLSAYGTLYKVYMDNVQDYVTNPPQGLLGRNVIVPQLGGPAEPGPPSAVPPKQSLPCTADGAQKACEAKYGTCFQVTGDCAQGNGYAGPPAWCNESGGGTCYGYETGCSGGPGRIWPYGGSYGTIDTWCDP